MISIIIPAYNNAADLPVTLRSVFAQGRRDFEVIVVNDGSSDNTDEVVRLYLDRIKYIKQENGGAPKARNRGFAESKGDYLIFLDADIVLEPHALSRLLEALNAHPDAAFAYPSFNWGWKKFEAGEYNAEKLKKLNTIHTSALIRRSAFPGFDESLKKFQDWDLWLTMLERGHYGVWVSEVLYTVKPQARGMSSWLPSIAYKIPWKKFGITIPAIEKYERGLEVIKAKHKLF